MSSAQRTASATSSGSFPARRTSRGPDASQKASPNRRCGEEPTSASYRSSTVLMKCDWPRMRLAPSGTATGTTTIVGWFIADLPSLGLPGSSPVLRVQPFRPVERKAGAQPSQGGEGRREGVVQLGEDWL